MITIPFQKSKERMKDGSVEPGGVDGTCSLTARFTSAEIKSGRPESKRRGKSYSSLQFHPLMRVEITHRNLGAIVIF